MLGKAPCATRDIIQAHTLYCIECVTLYLTGEALRSPQAMFAGLTSAHERQHARRVASNTIEAKPNLAAHKNVVLVATFHLKTQSGFHERVSHCDCNSLEPQAGFKRCATHSTKCYLDAAQLVKKRVLSTIPTIITP